MIIFDFFSKFLTNVFNHFKCLKQAVIALNFAKRPWLEMSKEGIVLVKGMQSNKMNIIQHAAYAFYREYSDVTPFVKHFYK